MADLYVSAMPGAGFSAVGDTWVGPMGATMGWSKGDQAVQVAAAIGVPTTVSITVRAPAGAPNPSPKPQPTAPGQAGQMRVINSFTLLQGSDTVPSVFSSYHLEVTTDSPSWSDKLVRTVSKISADVEGVNVHFTMRDTVAGKTTTTQAYKMGDKSYEVVKGKVVADETGMSTLGYITWPLDVVVALGIGSFRTASDGTATIDGRPVEVYRITGTVADDVSGMFASFGFPVTVVDGTVWVDAATGALLKADVGYTAELKNSDQKVRVTTKGSFTVVVSKAGGTTVSLP